MSKQVRTETDASTALKIFIMIAMVTSLLLISYLIYDNMIYMYATFTLLFIDLALYMVWVLPKMRRKVR